jgi:hypothetical protein
MEARHIFATESQRPAKRATRSRRPCGKSRRVNTPVLMPLVFCDRAHGAIARPVIYERTQRFDR